MDLLKYLEKRQLDCTGLKKNVCDMLIEKIGCLPRKHDNEYNIDMLTGNTFACKFSRNKNNLHIVGCSTEYGEIIVENTSNYHDSMNEQFLKNKVHDNAIFNFAWAEPQMKLVTACGDQTSKLFNVNPSGKLDEEKEFLFDSSVKSVMFCPGSSNIFCGGCKDGSIKVWDARVNGSNTVNGFDHNILYAHGKYSSASKTRESRKGFGISTVIFKNDLTVISSSAMDPAIKVWDLRKSYRKVKINTEPLPLVKYFHPLNHAQGCIGFSDMIINPQSTHLYGSGVDNIIYCFQLDSTERDSVCKFSGHSHETSYSKISMSNDGRYLFTGCVNQTGIMWLTDFPYIEEPVFEIMHHTPYFNNELSTSDWCADPTCLKLVSSADSMPMIWSVRPGDHLQNTAMSISRTHSTNKPKLFFKNVHTAPIKIDAELKEKYKEETEKNMELWDVHHHNLVPTDNLQVTPKKPWEVLFSKTKSPSSSQKSPQLVSHSSVSDQIPEVVTPTSSRKRKKSMISPRSLIDQYLVPNNKREKLKTVSEL